VQRAEPNGRHRLPLPDLARLVKRWRISKRVRAEPDRQVKTLASAVNPKTKLCPLLPAPAAFAFAMNAYPFSATSWLKTTLDGVSPNCGYYRSESEKNREMALAASPTIIAEYPR
jgi:hypothetical protein